MTVTPERRAELKAMLEEAIGGPLPRATRPKVVTSKIEATSEVVRDADVKVSKADPNYSESEGGEVRVRRNDWVTINMRAYEEQMYQRWEDRRHRRLIDPCRMGHWGHEDED
jgi:hypothetical protein